MEETAHLTLSGSYKQCFYDTGARKLDSDGENAGMFSSVLPKECSSQACSVWPSASQGPWAVGEKGGLGVEGSVKASW